MTAKNAIPIKLTIRHEQPDIVSCGETDPVPDFAGRWRLQDVTERRDVQTELSSQCLKLPVTIGHVPERGRDHQLRIADRRQDLVAGDGGDIVAGLCGDRGAGQFAAFGIQRLQQSLISVKLAYEYVDKGDRMLTGG
jgi:hypothetical protein